MALFPHRHSKPGTPPGTVGRRSAAAAAPATIRVLHYSTEAMEELEGASAPQALVRVDPETVTWIDVVGVEDTDLLQELGEGLGLHPLALEDVVNVGQRPKVEDYDDHLFLILKLHRRTDRLSTEQIALFVGAGYVLTVQEIPGDVFEPVRERIRAGRPRIRSSGADYLAYALIDALVDSYFPLLESYGELLEELEEELMESHEQESLNQLYSLKKQFQALRRAAWPQREVVASLERAEMELIRPETKIFLRDCYDHAVQILDMVETYRDLATGLMDLYMTGVSNRMNEVMKVLTVMASIFIPLTFIAGIYGMNFDPEASPLNMPELEWFWGYPAALALMAAIAGGMIFFFRRKGWL